MRTLLFSALLVAGFSTFASPADAQVYVGIHGAWADETLDGSWGGGIQVAFDPPAMPIDIVASGEFFDADCEAECNFYGGSLDARFHLPLPVIRPYGTAGLVLRKFETSEEGDWESGVGVGAGVDVSTPIIRVFFEGRWETVDVPDDQMVWRAGIIF